MKESSNHSLSPQHLASELASLRIDRSETVTGTSNSRRGRVRIVALTVAIAVGAGATAWVLRAGGSRLVAAQVEFGQVSMSVPSQPDVLLVATGYVVSNRRATLGARTAGRIVHLFAGEGERVTAGQLLAELDSAEARAQVKSVHADLELALARVGEARAQVKELEIRARREFRLQGGGAGTTASTEDADARVSTARAQLASALASADVLRARLHVADVALDSTRIRAPFDAIVLRKLAEEGEVTSPSGFQNTAIYQIAAFDSLQVEADVSEAALAKVVIANKLRPEAPKTGQPRETGVPAEIALDAFPDRRFLGEVIRIRPMVDRTKATVTVIVRFVDASEGVLPDMSAKVNFLSRRPDPEALSRAAKRVIPADAVVQRDGRPVVFQLDQDRVSEVPVRVGAPFGAGMVELVDGPATGATVVRSPDMRLASGDRVRRRE